MSISDWLIGVTGFWFVSGADTEDRPSLTPPELGGLVVEAFARAAENGTGTECAFAQRPGRAGGPSVGAQYLRGWDVVALEFTGQQGVVSFRV
jgi:hypothetical protein